MNSSMKRLGIFVFFDKQGVVDRYIDTYLNSLAPFLEKVICIVNGTVNDAGMNILSHYCDPVIVRDNSGYDAAAYKRGFIYASQNLDLNSYDEMIFFNDTVFGPIYPFSEVFDKMDKKTDIDFWGITRCNAVEVSKDKFEHEGFIPEHVQSYFLAIRSKLMKSKDFSDYWDNLPIIKSYDDAVYYNEISFTRHFSSMGYKWATYIEESWYDDYHEYVLMSYPKELLKSQRCPLVKRKTFSTVFENRIIPTNVNAGRNLYDFIKRSTDYDPSLITENITRTESIRDYEYSLAPVINIDLWTSPISPSNEKTAIILWLDSFKMINQYRRLKTDPFTDIYAVCSDVSISDAIKAIIPSCITYTSQMRGLEYIFKEECEILKTHTYIWYSSNHIFSEDIEDVHIIALEEIFKSIEVFGDIPMLKDILSSNKDISALVPAPTGLQTTPSRRRSFDELGKQLSLDLSAGNTASPTFFMYSGMIIDHIDAAITLSENRIESRIPSSLVKEYRSLVGIINSDFIESSKSSMYLSYDRQKNLDSLRLKRLDKARSFTEDFFTKRDLKNRIWFLILALFPKYRAKVFREYGLDKSVRPIEYENKKY